MQEAFRHHINVVHYVGRSELFNQNDTRCTIFPAIVHGAILAWIYSKSIFIATSQTCAAISLDQIKNSNGDVSIVTHFVVSRFR